MTLSQTLRSFAAQQGMTHRQGQINVGKLAARLGVPKPTLNNWLADEAKVYHKEPTGLARVALRAIVGDWESNH